MMDRRGFLTLFGGGLAACALAGARLSFAQAGAAAGKVAHSAAEWKKLLTPAQYHILREEGTEAPWTSALLKEHRAGTSPAPAAARSFSPRPINSTAAPAGRAFTITCPARSK
jgi:hypothetical protein